MKPNTFYRGVSSKLRQSAPVRQSPEKKAEEQVDDEEEDLERLADALEETALASYNLPRFKGE